MLGCGSCKTVDIAYPVKDLCIPNPDLKSIQPGWAAISPAPKCSRFNQHYIL
jgi:hypothetical protein